MVLEEQLQLAFQSFAASLVVTPIAFAREREYVSSFVLGHLAPLVRPGAALFDLTQIGIEVAVPQRRTATNRRRHPDVCKDVVIWSDPGMTCWDARGFPSRFPAAVLEWKALNRQDPPAVRARKRAKDRDADRAWLGWFTHTSPDALGFSVLVDSTSSPPSIDVERVAKGVLIRGWLASARGGQAATR
jgi:hypothetical protein